MSHKLTYFPIPGRAYVARVCFGIGGVDFVDEKISGKNSERGAEKVEGVLKFLSVSCVSVSLEVVNNERHQVHCPC